MRTPRPTQPAPLQVTLRYPKRYSELRYTELREAWLRWSVRRRAPPQKLKDTAGPCRRPSCATASGRGTRPPRELRTAKPRALAGRAVGAVAVEEVEDDPLAEAALADLQGLAEQLGDLLQEEDAGGEDADPARVELEASGDVGGRVAGEDADRRAPGSRTRAPRRPGGAARSALPPTATACVGVLDLDALEEVLDVVADACGSPPPRAGRRRSARRRGRRSRCCQERTSSTPPGTVPRITSVEPPPTSTTPISPSTGWPSALVAPMKESRPSSSSLRISTVDARPPRRSPRATCVAVARLAHRRGRDGADRLGAELARQPHLGRDHLADLVDLLRRRSRRQRRAPCRSACRRAAPSPSSAGRRSARRRARGSCWNRYRSQRRASGLHGHVPRRDADLTAGQASTPDARRPRTRGIAR